ncbi:hypothetical protein EG832_05410 [bacterium]|nr:hypothetical protein [bacterium]
MDGDIVWIEINGEFLADEMISETKKWMQSQKDSYIGYLVDIRKMTKQSAVEQKKVEEEAKNHGTRKPRAVLGKDIAMAAIVNIYQRFTGAEGVHFFTDEASAKKWLHEYKA